MFMDLIIIFIILMVIFFIISIILIEEKPFISIPFILLGMIFSILCSYGFWKVDFLYVNYNATLGNSSTEIYSTTAYGEPYSYIFVFIFFIFFALFFLAGFNMWRDALKTQGEIEYNKKNKWK